MGKEPKRWISEWRTGRLWHIRPVGYFLETVAGRAGVEYRQKPSYYGSHRTWIEGAYSFDAADVRRTAADIVNGEVEVDPAWRTDTPEGRWIYRRFLIAFILGRLFAVLFLCSPVVFVVMLVIAFAHGG